jgi:tocopherol cyclase
MRKNAYKLQGKLSRKGYDWWWHSFTGKDAETGELKPFLLSIMQ